MPRHDPAQTSNRRVDTRAVQIPFLQCDPPALPQNGRFQLVCRIEVASGHQRHVLLELGIGRPRIASPQAGQEDPADEAPPDRVGRELSTLARQVNGGRDQYEIGRQVVQTADERLLAQYAHQMLERRLHLLPGALQSGRGRLQKRPFQQHRAGRGGGETAHQEVQIDGEAAGRHLAAERAQLCPGLGPQAADVREGEVRSREGRPPAVDPVEDVDDLLDAVVVAGPLIYGVGVVADLVELAQSSQVLLDDRAPLLVELFQPFEQGRQSLLQELVNADPRRVVLHTRLLPEAELLGLHVEVQVEEERLALVEPRRLAPEQHIQRRQTLLSVEQQQRMSVARRLAAAHQRRLVRAPDQEMSRRMLPIEGLHQPAHLIAVPDVPTLELGQQDLVAAGLIQQVLDRLHLVHRTLSRQTLSLLSR